MAKKLLIKKSIKVRANDPNFVLVFDPEKDFFHEFNSTAGEIFCMYKDGLSDKKIATKISNDYGIDLISASKEITSLRKKIIKMGIAYEAQD